MSKKTSTKVGKKPTKKTKKTKKTGIRIYKGSKLVFVEQKPPKRIPPARGKQKRKKKELIKKFF